MFFEKVKGIWYDLDSSFENYRKADETKKDFLKRITDFDRGNNLPVLIARLEQEMESNPDLLEEGRPIVGLISLISNNLNLILSKEFQSFRQVISDIHNTVASKTRDLSLSDFNFNVYLPVVMDAPVLMVTHKTTGTVVQSNGPVASVVVPLPMPLQTMIGFAGVGSAIEFKNHFGEKELSPYLKFILDNSKTFVDGEATKEYLFLPKGSYRKTPSGYNFYINNSTYRASFVEDMGDYILCEYEGVNLVLVPYEYSIN